jgi:toxin secretion/phage lysis holin
VGNNGIPGKVLMFMVVAVANLLDQTLSDGHMLRDATIAFYIANEVISIIENIGRAGVPIPDVIRKAIAVLSEKGNADKGSDKE